MSNRPSTDTALCFYNHIRVEFGNILHSEKQFLYHLGPWQIIDLEVSNMYFVFSTALACSKQQKIFIIQNSKFDTSKSMSDQIHQTRKKYVEHDPTLKPVLLHYVAQLRVFAKKNLIWHLGLFFSQAIMNVIAQLMKVIEKTKMNEKIPINGILLKWKRSNKIPSPLPSVKTQIIAGKVYLR